MLLSLEALVALNRVVELVLELLDLAVAFVDGVLLAVEFHL